MDSQRGGSRDGKEMLGPRVREAPRKRVPQRAICSARALEACVSPNSAAQGRTLGQPPSRASAALVSHPLLDVRKTRHGSGSPCQAVHIWLRQSQCCKDGTLIGC